MKPGDKCIIQLHPMGHPATAARDRNNGATATFLQMSPNGDWMICHVDGDPKYVRRWLRPTELVATQ